MIPMPEGPLFRSVRAFGWPLAGVLMALVVTLLTPLGVAQAQAPGAYYRDPDRPLLPLRLDGHAALSWDGKFGAGARADFPILENALVFTSKDQLAISVGADVLFVSFSGSDPVEVWPTAAIQWSLGVNDKFVFYPELGLAGLVSARDGWGGVFPNVGFGGRYYVYRSISILGRLGWPMALSVGLTF